jgi:hypothetical protein
MNNAAKLWVQFSLLVSFFRKGPLRFPDFLENLLQRFDQSKADGKP